MRVLCCFLFVALLLNKATQAHGRGCNTTPKPPCSGKQTCTTKPPQPLKRCPECVNTRCTPNACNLAVGVYYPGDCTKFCKCDHGGAIEFFCPEGLFFEESLGVCVWPHQSSCSNLNNIYPGCETQIH